MSPLGPCNLGADETRQAPWMPVVTAGESVLEPEPTVLYQAGPAGVHVTTHPALSLRGWAQRQPGRDPPPPLTSGGAGSWGHPGVQCGPLSPQGPLPAGPALCTRHRRGPEEGAARLRGGWDTGTASHETPRPAYVDAYASV